MFIGRNSFAFKVIFYQIGYINATMQGRIFRLIKVTSIYCFSFSPYEILLNVSFFQLEQLNEPHQPQSYDLSFEVHLKTLYKLPKC